MKPNFSQIAASRISNAVKAPQGKKSTQPVKVRPITPGRNLPGNVSKPGNRFGQLKPEGAKTLPKPFQPGFTAGKSGKIPPGLARAAANRLKSKKPKIGSYPGKPSVGSIPRTTPSSEKAAKNKSRIGSGPRVMARAGTKWYK